MKSKKGLTVYKLEEVEYKDTCIDADFELGYLYIPGEEEVKYYPDGSGYPGSPEQLELYDIKCTKVYFEDYEIENPEEPLSGEMYDLFVDNEEMIKERILQDIYDSYYDDLADKYERYK
jgi:hypothetical protein